jgi:tRNA A58 N-methylase Trm61
MKKSPKLHLSLLLLVLICWGLPSAVADETTDTLDRRPDVIYVPTPQAAVNRMIELAEIQPGDLVYDLGCGDGRIVVTAAQKHGVRAIGVDIDPVRVEESKENVRQAGVEALVTIEHGDIFDLDLSEADVVFLYLQPRLNERLMPQLAKMKPGSRIVSFEFDMGNAEPLLVERGRFDELSERRIYKWVVPWEDKTHPDWDIYMTEP